MTHKQNTPGEDRHRPRSPQIWPILRPTEPPKSSCKAFPLFLRPS